MEVLPIDMSLAMNLPKFFGIVRCGCKLWVAYTDDELKYGRQFRRKDLHICHRCRDLEIYDVGADGRIFVIMNTILDNSNTRDLYTKPLDK